ncbi:MAG: sialate O-acetylesterase [Pseudomonadota bacterium]
MSLVQRLAKAIFSNTLAPCRVATTTSITLSGTQTIDGISVVSGDRVLVKNQTNAAENGVWVASGSAWTRAVDLNGGEDIISGTVLVVTEGTKFSEALFQVIFVGEFSAGTTELTISKVFDGDAAEIATVAADLDGADTIGIVATDLAGDDDIGTVAGSIANVTTVATNIADVQEAAREADPALVVLVSGQSHVVREKTGTDTFPSNLYVWDWDVDTPSTEGTQFISWPTDRLTNVAYMGKELALAYPKRRIHIIPIGIGGSEIANWLPGAPSTDVYDIIDSNMPAAMTASSRTEIDAFVWWHGDQDVNTNNYDYEADFETMIARFEGETWFPEALPKAIFQLNNEGNGAPAGYDQMNTFLENIVANDPQWRKLVRVDSLEYDTDNIHNTLADMPLAGRLFVDAYLRASGAHYESSRRLNPNGDLAIWRRGDTQTSIGSNGKRYCADRYWAFNRGSDGAVSATKTAHAAGQGQRGAANYALLAKTSGTQNGFGIATNLPIEDTERLLGRSIIATVKLRRGSTAFANNFNLRLKMLSTEARDGTAVQTATQSYAGTRLNASKFNEFSVVMRVQTGITPQCLQFEIEADEAGGATVALHVSEIDIRIGSVPVPFEVYPTDQEQLACARYYLESPLVCSGSATAGSQTDIAISSIHFPAPMRIDNPTITVLGTPTRTNCTTDPAVIAANSNEFGAVFNNPASSGSGALLWRGFVTVDAEIQ